METAIRKSGTKDLTEGLILKKVIFFTLPIILTGVLQLLFNTADVLVVGNFASKTALSAVGSTSAITNLIVNFLVGSSVGAGVLVANFFGSKDDKAMEETVHTAMLTAVIGGLVFGAIGWVLSKHFLIWMGTPDDVIEQATLYTRLYFLGVPFSTVYNFSASILRSVGDTKRPLYFLLTAGIVNVIFNLFFVLVLKMDVAGVAIATVISQIISSFLAVRHMMKTDASHKLVIKNLRIVKDKLKGILSIGLPAGIQGSLFSVSNILVQAGVNKFGSVAMAGNAAAANIEAYVLTAMNAFHHTAIAFIGQNIGAGKRDRVKKSAVCAVACVIVVGLALGIPTSLLGKYLIGLYVSGDAAYESEVIGYGLTRMSYVATFYALCGVMEVLSGVLRGMKKSFTAMIIVLSCVCGFRVLWIYTAFKAVTTLDMLYVAYPISWVICIVAQFIALVIEGEKIKKQRLADQSAEKVEQAEG